MFSKIFFVLAAVCVVKASVIADNVFSDDPETEVASDPKACSPQACRDACRRLGFPIGVCSGGRCFCRRAKAQEDVLEEDPLDLEELVSRTENDPESDVASDPKSCNAQACRNACRRLGFSTGVCSGGRCFCRRSNVQEDVSEQELSHLEELISRTEEVLEQEPLHLEELVSRTEVMISIFAQGL
ncbi:hypothetical protein PYW07_015787 [Mythimna separata]|uniref:Knottins-like domain-containing protein n=1 Tax=Mythimna separata TaxID=271217 RepID=A0AAD7YSI3_MYTSE|nr:hypothetical protein PYW07_015787 [Mythimna separata]